MRKKILIFVFALISLSGYSQNDPKITLTGTNNQATIYKGAVGANTAMLLPLGTHAALYPDLPMKGRIQLNAETNKLEVHDGTQWVELGSGVGASGTLNDVTKIGNWSQNNIRVAAYGATDKTYTEVNTNGLEFHTGSLYFPFTSTIIRTQNHVPTQNNVIELPGGSGTMPLSVNGKFADIYGNIAVVSADDAQNVFARGSEVILDENSASGARIAYEVKDDFGDHSSYSQTPDKVEFALTGEMEIKAGNGLKLTSADGNVVPKVTNTDGDKNMVLSINGSYADANGNVTLSGGGGNPYRFGVDGEDEKLTDDRFVDFNTHSAVFDNVGQLIMRGWNNPATSYQGVMYKTLSDFKDSWGSDENENMEVFNGKSIIVYYTGAPGTMFEEFPYFEGADQIKFRLYNSATSEVNEINYERQDVFAYEDNQVIFVGPEINDTNISYAGYNYIEYVSPNIQLNLPSAPYENQYPIVYERNGNLYSGSFENLIKFDGGFTEGANGIRLGGEVDYNYGFGGEFIENSHPYRSGTYTIYDGLRQNKYYSTDKLTIGNWTNSLGQIQGQEYTSWSGHHTASGSQSNTGWDNYSVESHVGVYGEGTTMNTMNFGAWWHKQKFSGTDGSDLGFQRLGMMPDANSTMLVQDGINQKGLEYYADYSANYTDRSLVDKAYVDSVAGGGGSAHFGIEDNIFSTDRAIDLEGHDFVWNKAGLFKVGSGGGTLVPVSSNVTVFYNEGWRIKNDDGSPINGITTDGDILYGSFNQEYFIDNPYTVPLYASNWGDEDNPEWVYTDYSHILQFNPDWGTPEYLGYLTDYYGLPVIDLEVPLTTFQTSYPAIAFFDGNILKKIPVADFPVPDLQQVLQSGSIGVVATGVGIGSINEDTSEMSSIQFSAGESTWSGNTLTLSSNDISFFGMNTPKHNSKYLINSINGTYMADAQGNVEIPKPYKVYTALVSQSGTSTPTVIELENTIGTIRWSYNTVGSYNINGASLFTADKTVIFTSPGQTGLGNFSSTTTNDSIINFKTNVSGTPTDGQMSKVSVEIRVYN
jgi:hypothetical protein